MTSKRVRTAMRVAAVLATTCGVTLSMASRAAARDDGVLEFFTSAFGGAGPTDSEDEGSYRDRPLTVRPKRAPRLAVVPVPVKPQVVSILDDTTLRRGDAVMTKKGMRIFVGSAGGPHTVEDFVDLTRSDRAVSKTTEKVLADLDRRPGG